MELTIYLDILVIINLIMNYLILWTTGQLIKVDYRVWRLILSSISGTLYTVLILFPQMQFWNNLIVYFLVSLIMMIIAYFPLHLRQFFKAMGYFYLITFLAAGVLMAGYNLNLKSQFSEITGNFNLSLKDTWIFLLGIAVLWLLGKFSWKIFQGQMPGSHFLFPLVIEFGGEKLKVQALVDTGNQLKDPLTDTPVIIVELDFLLDVFPEQIEEIFTNYDLQSEIEELATALSETTWANRFRLIPFSAVGNQQGLLIGLKPDKVVFNLKEEKITTDHVIIGVYDQQFEEEASYAALVNPELLDIVIQG